MMRVVGGLVGFKVVFLELLGLRNSFRKPQVQPPFFWACRRVGLAWISGFAPSQATKRRSTKKTKRGSQVQNKMPKGARKRKVREEKVER